MFPHDLATLILLFLARKTLAAVLTSTVNVYFPLQHGNALPASQNGVVSFLGEANGITTYILNEPQSPELTATFIDGPNLAVVIVSANPSFIASYSCDVHGPQAVCLEANINPENGQIVSQLSTEAVDSIALLEVGSPQPAPPPPPPPTAAPPDPRPTPTSSPNEGGGGGGGSGGSGGNGGGNGGNPSPPSGNSAASTSETTAPTNNSPSTGAPDATQSDSSSASSTAAVGGLQSGSGPSIPGLPSNAPGKTGGGGSSTQGQGILPDSSSGKNSVGSVITSLSISIIVVLAPICISRLW